MGATLATRIIKVDHSGEFGAINIYRAQIFIGRLTGRQHVALLKEFLTHERRHLEIFGSILAARRVSRCKSYWLCGLGGYCLGLLTGLLGKGAVMSCTAAVEDVVLRHLRAQLQTLEREGDRECRDAVASIIADEDKHLESGMRLRSEGPLYRLLHGVVAASTETVIWLGMKL